MKKQKINHDDWIVVCDGRKALILRNAGDELYPNLKMVEVHEHDDAQTSALGADRPGRVHTAAATGQTARSAVEQTDWHDAAERTFLKALAVRLDKAVVAGEAHAIHVVAPPRALGVLRQAYSPTLRGKLRGEFEHEYVKLPVDEIERRLFA
jgi:protein required for attachment to host cells